MLKVAIVGCGKIADSHAAQIQRIPACEIVAVCDREPLMARQLFERFPVKGAYSDLTQLLNEARPDVVHLTTPPETHFDLAMRCLDAGCHVYVEKPFTLDGDDARRLLAHAVQRQRKVTTGHDDQFSHVARRMRSLVQDGYLGGRPVHMESHFGYELDQTYAHALLRDRQHWVRRLPGKLFQNIISHGVARVAEFLAGQSPTVIAHAFGSPMLTALGETEILDELRVIIIDEEGTTAYFTFSSQMRPSLHTFAIYGPKNGLVLDQDHETLITLSGAKHKSYMAKFVPPIVNAKQQVANVAASLRAFLRHDFHPKAGMKYLIESFYRSIVDDTPVPIPYREIQLTASIRDRIFEQVPTGRPADGPAGRERRVERAAQSSLANAGQ